MSTKSVPAKPTSEAIARPCWRAVTTSASERMGTRESPAAVMGAAVIISGVSPEIAQTLVRLGTELHRLTTVGDLQGGIDMADRLIGYRVVRTSEGSIPDLLSPS